MTAKSLPVPDYWDACDRGTVTNQDAYHQPGSGPRGHPRCGCSNDTDRGAYRDVIVEVDGVTVYYYHHSPVVVRDGDTYRLDSCGHRTRTTKQRINRHTPPGYTVIQRDFEWYVETPEGRRDFTDGMTITV
jgi:hypothetical protein